MSFYYWLFRRCSHTVERKTERDSVICHFFFPRNWRLKSLCTEMRTGRGGKEKSGWSSTAIRLNEAGRERGSFIGNQSMISQGIISVRFEREKLLHRVEQIKFLTNASLNGLALYCSFNPVPCFRTNPCESLMNSYDSGRETPRIFINIGKKFALRIGSILWTFFHHV